MFPEQQEERIAILGDWETLERNKYERERHKFDFRCASLDTFFRFSDWAIRQATAYIICTLEGAVLEI
jgi:hypothetical protein